MGEHGRGPRPDPTLVQPPLMRVRDCRIQGRIQLHRYSRVWILAQCLPPRGCGSGAPRGCGSGAPRGEGLSPACRVVVVVGGDTPAEAEGWSPGRQHPAGGLVHVQAVEVHLRGAGGVGWRGDQGEGWSCLTSARCVCMGGAGRSATAHAGFRACD